jgi:hypothetical protein
VCQANASSTPTGTVTLRSITSLLPAMVPASLKIGACRAIHAHLLQHSHFFIDVGRVDGVASTKVLSEIKPRLCVPLFADRPRRGH